MILPRSVRNALRIVAALALLALYGPLLLVVLRSFFASRQGAIAWDRFGLDAYAALFRNAGIGESLLNTLLVGIGAGAASLVLGTGLAFWYQARSGRGRAVLQALLFLPFLLPPIVTGLSLLIALRDLGVPRSLWTVGLGHTVFVLALVYSIVLNRLQALRPSLVEASRDLGATATQTFRHVLLPHLGSALAAAAVLAFALSFDETMITLLVTGTDSTLPMRLWGMMRTGLTPDINALVSLVLLGTTLVCLGVARLVRS